MKRIALLLLICALLSACTSSPGSPSPSPEASPAEETSNPSTSSASPTPEPTPPPMLTEEEYPRVDGSTATIPLGAALLAHACGLPLEEAELYVEHSTTYYSYVSLLDGQADLLLAYEPPEGAFQYAKEGGQELGDVLDMAPIGRDALVFLTNENNPVRSLGSLQIVSIYQGKTKNWKDVGGENKPIAAFQRDPDSGSQTLMKKLVMKGESMAEPPTEMTPSEMGELIEGIAAYSNEANALGYSVYFYVKNMVDMPGLKLLDVDGVEPDNASIADGRYPYTNDFYVAVRKSEPQGSPARKLYEFLLSAEGKALIEGAGYVAVP